MKKAILILAALSAAGLLNAQKLVIKGSDTLGAKLSHAGRGLQGPPRRHDL